MPKLTLKTLSSNHVQIPKVITQTYPLYMTKCLLVVIRYVFLYPLEVCLTSDQKSC